MKKTMLTGLSLFVVSLFVGASVWAETVKGTVNKVDTAANTVEISKTDEATGAVEAVVIAVDPNTGYVGCAKLEEIKEGNNVTIEAELDEAGVGWTAKSVEVIQAAK